MIKRLFDLAVSVTLLTLLLPVLLIVALVVRVGSPGPVLHRALRVGQGEKIFTLYKFRTMIVGAEQQGPGITTADDPRVTRIGRWLRRTKLDELPQFFNVLRGDMSLVGPRPEDPRYVALYTPEQRAVFTVRPGITSLASVRYRHEEHLLTGPDWESRYVEAIMPAKLEHDLEYVRNSGLWRDLMILLQTFLALWQ